MFLYTPVQWLEVSMKRFENSIVIVAAALESFTFASLHVFTAVKVPQHIRELRDRQLSRGSLLWSCCA